MMKPTLIGAFIAVFLFAQPGHAQSAADLLQRGIFTQETTGDVDGAIKIYRQVVESASGNPANNLYAAQAQYRLVVCMLLKGDTAGATREFQLLEKNFPSQQDLVALARTMMPGSSAVLPVPWPESELSQLNIKRDGMLTGETLYYSVDQYGPPSLQQHQSTLRSELRTKNTTRGVNLNVDRETLRPVSSGGQQPYLQSNDDSGDPSADAFGGPAIDLEESVFLMRRLPLAAGFKTTMPVTSFTLGQKVPKQVDLAVTGIESVQVTAGKYNCYKVSVSPLGQTFWIGVDGARPLVKFQSGKVEADLVRVWGPGTGIEAALAFVPTPAWQVQSFGDSPGTISTAEVQSRQSNNARFHVQLTRTYTPAADIAEAMRQIIPAELKRHQGSEFKIRQDSIKTDPINGQQALRYIADVTEGGSSKNTYYEVWIRTEGSLIEFSASASPGNFPVLRFWVEPLLETAKIP